MSQPVRITGKPRKAFSVKAFPVKDELVLVSPAARASERTHRALTLNRSGRAIWDLCDGSRSVEGLVSRLAEAFAVDPDMLSEQTLRYLDEMIRLGFVEGAQAADDGHPPTTFVVGIEDTPYFWWQTAILLESFRDKLPATWKTLVVVCNDGGAISPDLAAILERYGTAVAVGANHGRSNRIDIGYEGGTCYAAANRIEALARAAELAGDQEMICLLDTDIFLYGNLNLDVMPTVCAVPRNGHIGAEPFFSSEASNRGRGVDLQKLLEAMGCQRPFAPGGVNVFVSAAVAKNPKFIADCFRFAHALYLLGRAAGVEKAWIAEMPCFALAMTANDVAYELLEQPELLVSSCDETSIPEGTLYHYYSDPADFGRAAFHGSKWHKQAFRQESLKSGLFKPYEAEATTDHERYFFTLAERARQRLNA